MTDVGCVYPSLFPLTATVVHNDTALPYGERNGRFRNRPLANAPGPLVLHIQEEEDELDGLRIDYAIQSFARQVCDETGNERIRQDYTIRFRRCSASAARAARGRTERSRGPQPPSPSLPLADSTSTLSFSMTVQSAWDETNTRR